MLGADGWWLFSSFLCLYVFGMVSGPLSLIIASALFKDSFAEQIPFITKLLC